MITHNLPKAEADQKHSKSRVHVYKMSCKFKNSLGKLPFSDDQGLLIYNYSTDFMICFVHSR